MCESSTIFSGRDEHGGSRRTHPSSQPAHYAVRTRGGCSYKIATPGGKPVASGRGLWARRSRKEYSPGCSAPALRLRCLRAYVGEQVCPPGGTSTSSSAGQQEDPPMEPAGALAVRTRGGCSYKIATPGKQACRVLSRPVGSTFPGSGSPGCSAPALHLRCLRAYVGERVCPREGRAPARPRCSRRARTSSQPARCAVRTRGGCSYKVTTPGS